MSYSFKMLYSGSRGNAALLRCGETAILIDAGRSAKALAAALTRAGVSPDAVSAIFLTHEHSDHTAALERFLKDHPTRLFAVEGSIGKLTKNGGEALLAALTPRPPVYRETVGPFTLSSFPTSHDSGASVGFRIEIADGEKTVTLGYATDLGVVTPAVSAGLCGCEAVVLEANHDEEMLKSGPYPAFLKGRIASRRGHLSNRDAAALATELEKTGMRRLMLAHLSEINNTPELALGEVRMALAGTAVSVSAADPDEITEL